MQERFYSTHVRRPKTHFFRNENYHLTMAVCSWGKPEDCKKFYDLTIENYNLMFNDDATSPFEQYLQLTNIQNKLRTAILMANEQIYREDNRNSYETGLEFFVMVQNPRLVHWAAVGQPSVFYLHQGQINTIYSATTTTISSDPVFLYGVGLEPKVQIQTGIFIRLGQPKSGQQVVFSPPPAAYHHRPPLELRVAQQLHRRVKRVHVQVGDAAYRCSRGRGQRGHLQSIALERGSCIGPTQPLCIYVPVHPCMHRG